MSCFARGDVLGPASLLFLTGFAALTAILFPPARPRRRGNLGTCSCIPSSRVFPGRNPHRGDNPFRETGTLYGVGLQAESAPAPGIRFQGRIESWGGGVSSGPHPAVRESRGGRRGDGCRVFRAGYGGRHRVELSRERIRRGPLPRSWVQMVVPGYP